jgi:hypothetical protein
MPADFVRLFSACVYTTLKSFDSLPIYITHKNRQPTYMITVFVCNTCCPLCEVKVMYVCSKFITKVKQSRNRPGVAQSVPGGLGSQIFMTFCTWRWWACQPHAPAAFTPRKCSWHSFSLGAESTPGPWCVRKEICHWKIQWHHRESIPGPSD